MSAQHYWNNGQDNSHQGYQSQSNNYDGQSPSYDQSQPHRPQEYSQDNEPMNWGYGGGSQQEPPQHQTHDYYNSQTSDQYSSQPYPSHDQSQGYGQTYQNYSQPEESYQPHTGYGDPSHSPQPPPYGSDTRDYNHPQTANQYNSSPYPEQGYPAQTYPGAPGQADGERGILGAIGGAAAGGFAGHKVNHGFLGAVGGAYAGHKLEEHLKDKKKKDRKEHRHGRSSSSSSSSSSDEEKKKHKYGTAAIAGAGVAGAAAYGHHQHHQHHQHQHHQHQHQHHQKHHGSDRGATTAGNFSATSSQISLDRDYDLIASCATLDNTHRLSSISLNDCLANEWGHLRWVHNGGFGASARNVRLIDGGRGLEAELGDGKGGWNVSRILLDERITNNNGDLQFLR